MKKFLVVAISLMFTVAVFGADLVKKADVTKEVAVKAVALSQADWEKANADARECENKEDLVGAEIAYLKVVEIAKQVNDGYADARVAWGLNNASYALIKRHQKDKTVDLSNAKKYLTEAIALKEKIGEECIRCIESNTNYVNTNMKVEVKKEILKPVEIKK